jgi:hypothetical protein
MAQFWLTQVTLILKLMSPGSRNAKQKNTKMRHQTDEYVMADGRRILLIARGRLANLGAAEDILHCYGYVILG